MPGASERRQTYVVEVGNGSAVQLSATAHFLLTRIDDGDTAEAVARELSQRLGRTVTAEHVEEAYAQVRKQVDAIADRPRRPKPFGLWFRVRLLPLSFVGWLARRLSFAFRPLVAVPLTFLAVFAAVPTLVGGTADHHQSMTDPGANLLPLVGLFMVSMLAHELGHASASMRYGVPARDIGFGLYLIYPVFYNDVTSAWQLTRRQRVVIDLAGLFFQSLVAAAFLLIHRLTGIEVFRVSAVSVLFLGLFMLLPIFKFDGYWLLSDLLGVPNLSRQVRRVAGHVRDRLRRKPAPPLPWPRRVSIAVLVYGVFSVLFLTVFVLSLGLSLSSVAAEYPARVAGLVRDLSAPPHTPATGRVSSVVGPTYLLLGVTFAFVRLGGRLFYAARPALRTRRTRAAVGS